MSMNCRVCGSVYIDFVSSDIYRCKDCESVCLHTHDTRFHNSVFLGTNTQNKNRFLVGIYRFFKVKFNRERIVQHAYYDWIVKQIEKYRLSPPKSILDIGCGDGTLLHLLQQKYHAEIMGFEADTDKVKLSKVSHAIRNDFWTEKTVVNKGIDLIILGQCIYYFYDPLAIVDQVVKLLSRTGAVFIATGNTNQGSIINGIKPHIPTVPGLKALQQRLIERGGVYYECGIF